MYITIRAHKKNAYLLDLLNKYVTHDNSADSCYVCLLQSESNIFINKICKCNMIIHLHCAQELARNLATCSICKSRYLVNEDTFDFAGNKSTDIYFPSAGVYPIPAILRLYQIVKEDDLHNRLKNAITYLQVAELRRLISMHSRETLCKIIREILSVRFNGIGIIQDNSIELLIVMCSNLPKNQNAFAYNMLETLLNDLLQNIDHIPWSSFPGQELLKNVTLVFGD